MTILPVLTLALALAGALPCNVNLRDHLVKVTGRDLRACFADVFGYKTLSPDQERHIELLQTKPRVCAMGGTGVGKSFVQGVTAAITVATTKQSKALFGGPRENQAKLLSWLELQRAVLAAKERGKTTGYILSDQPLGVTEWYPVGKDKRPDWFAVCMALSDRNNAASVKGMMHSARTVVALDELEGIAQEVQDALDAGTAQENVHFWVSFNPISENDAAGRFWTATPPDARIQMSAIACAEWQERTGVRIPGMPTLAALDAKWRGRENEPLYFTNVLGTFPPPSAQNTIVPRDWYNRLTNCVTEITPDDRARAGVGVDTGGGQAETGCCLRLGRVIMPIQAAREGHNTINAALAVQRYLSAENAQGASVAVDWIGTGGKGVGEQLQNHGSRVLVFHGGGQQLTELVAAEVERPVAKCPADYANLITWGYFLIHEDARRTIEAMDCGRPERYISFPPNDTLARQLERHFIPDKDRKYRLEAKDSSNSPDEADMAAMASVAAITYAGYTRTVTVEQVAPDLLTQGDSIGERF